MHEMALALNVIDIAAEAARAHAAARVLRVRLRIGALAAVEPEALRFCFAAAARGTPVEDAALEIARTDGRAWCAGCGRTVVIGSRAAPCPECGAAQLLVTGGEDLAVQDLEVA